MFALDRLKEKLSNSCKLKINREEVGKEHQETGKSK
jgi:hypothetical protein